MTGAFPWIILSAVVIGGIVVYLLFMVFLPEWVGITGKKALENERSHRGTVEEPSATDAPKPDQDSH